MKDPEKVAKAIYDRWGPSAVRIKVYLQMAVGLVVVVSLVTNLGVHLVNPDFAIAESIDPKSLHWSKRLLLLIFDSQPLKIVGFWLSISAGLELAYMLYTPGPDEAIEPLILGVTSALLIIISGVDVDNTNWQLALTVLVLSGTLGFLFYIREKFVEQEKERKRRIPVSSPEPDQVADRRDIGNRNTERGDMNADSNADRPRAGGLGE